MRDLLRERILLISLILGSPPYYHNEFNNKTTNKITKKKTNHQQKWLAVKAVKEWAKLVPRDTQRDPTRLLLRESPSPLLEDSQEEVVLREFPLSSTTTPDKSSSLSSRTLSEMPSLTLSTLVEKPSLLWTLSTLSRDKEEPSTDSVAEQSFSHIKIHKIFIDFSNLYLIRLCKSSYSSKTSNLSIFIYAFLLKNELKISYYEKKRKTNRNSN